MGRKKEVSDEALLAKAREIFIEEGHTVATGVIAKAAGVSQATLFNRFGTKRRLMILALAPHFDIDGPTIPLTPDQRSIPLQLVELGLHLYQQMRENEPGFRVLLTAGVTFQELQSTLEDFAPFAIINVMVQWIQRAQETQLISDALEPMTFALVFGGSVKNLALDEIHAQTRAEAHGVTHYITQLVDLLWRGLAPTS